MTDRPAMTNGELADALESHGKHWPGQIPIDKVADMLAACYGNLSQILLALRQGDGRVEKMRALAERYAVTIPFILSGQERAVYACAECLAQGDELQDVQHEPHCPFSLIPKPAGEGT